MTDADPAIQTAQPLTPWSSTELDTGAQLLTARSPDTVRAYVAAVTQDATGSQSMSIPRPARFIPPADLSLLAADDELLATIVRPARLAELEDAARATVAALLVARAGQAVISRPSPDWALPASEIADYPTGRVSGFVLSTMNGLVQTASRGAAFRIGDNATSAADGGRTH